MGKSKTTIQLATDLSQFFKDEVRDTAQKQGLSLTPHVSEYLARILERFAKTQDYLLQHRREIESAELNEFPGVAKMPTMATMWLESFHLSPSQQFFQLQNLGDFALFTSGYFSDYVRKSLLDQDYYFAIGGQAYERAGVIRESISSERAVNTYFELAEGFKQFAEIFAELSDRTLLGSDKDILKLYGKWLDLKSGRIARMLAENGIIASDAQRGRGNVD